MKNAFSRKSVIECSMALQLVFAYAVLDIIGTKAFDREFGSKSGSNADFAIGFGGKPPQSKLRTLWKSDVNLTTKKDLLPGGFVYFHNAVDYDPHGPWKGENTVFLGDGKFSRLGLDRKTEEQINRKLFYEYKESRGYRTYPKVDQSQWLTMKRRGGNELVGIDLFILRPTIEQILSIANKNGSIQ